LNSNYKPLIVAVFLVALGLLSSSLYPNKTGLIQIQGVLGGSPKEPGLVSIAQGAQVIDSSPATLAQPPIVALSNGGIAGSNAQMMNAGGASDASDGSIQDPGQPIGSALANFTSSGGNTARLQSGSTLPKFNGYFITPAQGQNSKVLDANNGVEIVNSCGTPVFAAADGVVVPDPQNTNSLGGWNGGYGNFVLIEHPFGNEIFTRYAHLQQSLVQIGDYVKQGQKIGLMGQSGGATNCELDFEIIGAQNPFGK
jgi:murein DD-endopeptidase MepM/ murein hydrolase activator NlpD